MSIEFEPTHRIFFEEMEGTVDQIEVMLESNPFGPAYTREEWESESLADFEKTPDGWKFQGRVFNGEVRKL